MTSWNILACEWLTPVGPYAPMIRVDPDLWCDAERFADSVRTIDALIVRNQARIDADLLRHAERLRVVGRLGAGLDNVDVAAVRSRGATVVYAPEANTRAVAEFCLAQMFALLRNLPQAIHSTARGEWNRTAFFGREIASCTVGLVGYGRIGRELAGMLLSLGASVLVFSRHYVPATSRVESVTLDQLLARADIVSIHLPGGPQTRGLIGSRELGLMKKGALLLNTARGGVVNEDALLTALESGALGGVALDVREREPPVIGALERLPNALLTPHVAAYTQEAQERVALGVIEDVLAVLEGRSPRYPAP